MRTILCLLIVTAANPAIAQTPDWLLTRTRDSQTDQPLQRFKQQALQRVAVKTGTLISHAGDLNTGFLETSVGLGVPLGSLDRILGVTPSFRVDWLSGDDRTGLPSELYEVGLQFFYRHKFNDRWSGMAIVNPSIRSDFTTDDNAFRVFAIALLTNQCVPDYLSVSFGAVSLGRADLPILPALGLNWSPTTRTRLELRFPESRLAHRLAKDGSLSETWCYASAGLGGNTWATTRAPGLTDELSLRDIHLNIGLERMLDGGGGCFIEAGYAFSRQLEFESGRKTKLSDGILLRAGWAY